MERSDELKWVKRLDELKELTSTYGKHEIATQLCIRSLERWASDAKKTMTSEERKKLEDMANNVANTVSFLLKEMFHVKQRNKIVKIK